MMTLIEAIAARHSVRHYLSRPLTPDMIRTLQEKAAWCNREGNLHIQLVLGETKAFSGIMAYGAFSGVENYLVMAGGKADDLDERIGYYGEQLVLLATRMGLGTCWAGLSYRQVKGVYRLKPGEKVACMIALGFPDDPGRKLKRKSPEEVSNVSDLTPPWFAEGVKAALLAPTAVNQQKFRFDYLGLKDGIHQVRASRLFSLIGYTQMDLGIARLHFEIGAGNARFRWVQ